MVLKSRLAVIAALLCPMVFVFPDQPWLTLVGVGVFVALLWLIDFALAPSPNRIGLARSIPRSISLGRTGTVGWSIRNDNRQPANISFAESFAPSLGADTRRAELRLHGGRSARVETDLTPERRGRFELGEFVIRTDGPLGFAGRQVSRWIPAEVRVLPRFPSRAEAELRIQRSRLEIGLRSARMRGGGSEFDQLRDFTQDDEFRRIDWSATARAGRTIVRTYRAEQNQTVINIVDNGRLMAGQVVGFPRVEYAMDAVMGLTTLATGLGDKAGLLVFDREVRGSVPASNKSSQLQRVTDLLFDLEPELAESDYRSAFTEVLLRFNRRTMLVIHTELAEQAVGEFLLPALPLLTRSHVVVLATVQDPEVMGWAADVPNNAAEAHRHAAAVALLGERRRTIAELRRVGATVVDAPPGELAGRLMDHYLEAKATGRL